jgi:hypothetical protein
MDNKLFIAALVGIINIFNTSFGIIKDYPRPIPGFPGMQQQEDPLNVIADYIIKSDKFLKQAKPDVQDHQAVLDFFQPVNKLAEDFVKYISRSRDLFKLMQSDQGKKLKNDIDIQAKQVFSQIQRYPANTDYADQAWKLAHTIAEEVNKLASQARDILIKKPRTIYEMTHPVGPIGAGQVKEKKSIKVANLRDRRLRKRVKV